MRAIYQCACPKCRSEEKDPAKEEHRRINVMMSRLDERQRRWFAASEAERIGWGGVKRMAAVTGLDRKTIFRGKRELAAGLEGRARERIRNPGAGRPRIEEREVGIVEALQQILDSETAGDPEGRRKWARTSLRELKRRLGEAGFRVSHETLRRLVKGLGYALRVNAKTKTGKAHPRRDEQFRYIEAQKEAFLAAGQPLISVDTKKDADRRLQE